MAGAEIDSNGGSGPREQEIAELEARLAALRAQTPPDPQKSSLATTAPTTPEAPSESQVGQNLSEVMGELLRPETITIVGSNVAAAFREISAMLSSNTAASKTTQNHNPFLQAFASKQSRASNEFRAVVAAHLDELARARLQTIRKDRYGRTLVEDWIKEATYFLNTVARPALSRYDAQTIAKLLERDGKWFFNVVEARSEELARSASFSKDMTPAEYEEFCAQLLSRSGWSARTTKASGDQGVDVIATRQGVRLVLQCKLYDSPVGNSAVQEAVSGKLHERADMAAVVTNSTFTPAARQLAQSTGTLLLHHTELEHL